MIKYYNTRYYQLFRILFDYSSQRIVHEFFIILGHFLMIRQLKLEGAQLERQIFENWNSTALSFLFRNGVRSFVDVVQTARVHLKNLDALKALYCYGPKLTDLVKKINNYN